MAHFFEKRDRWGNGYGLWILVGMAFLTPLAIWSCEHIRLENRLENWLPQDDPQAQLLEWTQGYFAQDEHLVLTWDDSSVFDPRLIALEEKLEGTGDPAKGDIREPMPEVERVISPRDVFGRMLEGGVDEDIALKRLTGVLIGPGPLRVRLSQDARSRQPEIIEELVQRGKTDLGLKFEVLPPLTRDDSAPDAKDEDSPAAQLAKLGTPAAHDFAVRWPQMHAKDNSADAVIDLVKSLGSPEGQDVEDAFFQPGTPAALGIAISYAGRRNMSQTLATIRQTAEEAGIPLETLRLGGRPVLGNELNQGVHKAFWNPDYPLYNFPYRSPLLFSALVGMLLAFWMLRSVRLSIMVLIATNFTVLMTLSLVPVTHGNMNIVLVCMPTLLSVVTISGAIHVANYWKYAALEHPKTAIATAIRMSWQPCALSSITTAIGSMSLTTSNLQPVREFGFYSAVGCIISLPVLLCCLPAMLQYWPGKVSKLTESDHRRWETISNWIVDHWKGVAVGSLLVTFASGLGLIWFHTETKVIRYFPDEKRVVQDYQYLEENLYGVVPVDVLVRFDHDSQKRLSFAERRNLVAEISQNIRNHPEISGTMSLADFVEFEIPVGENGHEPSSIQKMAAHRKQHEVEQRIKKGEVQGAQALLAVVRERRILEKIRGETFAVEPGDEIWRITAQVAMMSELNYADLTGDWMNPKKKPGELNTIVSRLLADQPGTQHIVTGMAPLFLKTQQAVLDSMVGSFGVSFLLIAIIMVYMLKHPVSGMLSMIPNVLPVVMVFGLISFAGISVDIGTMMTASVALGIAVDATLHLLTWFRKGIVEGLSRREAIAKAMIHCGPAMWQTSVAVGLGLMVLFPAELLLVSRFGWLMAALSGAGILGDLVVLPALLAGPMGTIIERSVAKAQAEVEAEAQAEAEAASALPLPSTELAPQPGHLA